MRILFGKFVSNKVIETRTVADLNSVEIFSRAMRIISVCMEEI